MRPMNTTATKAEPDPDHGKPMGRVAAASFIGNFVEWYDYAVYAYLATVIAAAFFPEPVGRLP